MHVEWCESQSCARFFFCLVFFAHVQLNSSLIRHVRPRLLVVALAIDLLSRCAGALLYIRQCHLLGPAGPRATGKRKAGSITFGYLAKSGKTLYCLVSWRVTSKSWLVCCDSRDLDYLCPFPRQRSEGSYRSLRRYARQRLVSLGPTL